MRIEDIHFEGEYDGKHWTVKRFWKDDKPPDLKNKISCYNRNVTEKNKEEYEKEIEMDQRRNPFTMGGRS